MTIRYALLLLLSSSAAAQTPCVGGFAGAHRCHEVDLMAHLPRAALGSGSGASDIWGWTDPETGREYAILGTDAGAVFVDVTDPAQPVHVGRLVPRTDIYSRGVKVYRDHVFVVGEVFERGMQVFDLTGLRGHAGPPVDFTETAYYDGVANAHTLALNEETGYAYALGAGTASLHACAGGLHIVDVRDPVAPVFAGCYAEAGYTHDAQCVVYRGPDAEYQGREVCFAYNGRFDDGDHLAIVDVTDKAAPALIAEALYPLPGFTHQGWLTEDHRFLLVNDEFDEFTFGLATRTIILDVSDLDDPSYVGAFSGRTSATDHNLYIRGGFAYLTNYTAGLSVLALDGIADGTRTEVAYFDTYSADDGPALNGAWGAYPFFGSGTLVVSDYDHGLFVLRPTFAGAPTGAEGAAPPAVALLGAVSPNPFTAGASVTLEVAEPQRVAVALFDLLGRRVATVYDGVAAAGVPHRLRLDGAHLPAGTYLLRATGATFSETRRVVLHR